MELEKIKHLFSNVEYKQMKYQQNRKFEILFDGKYRDYQFYILNLGTHPTAYIEIPINNKLYGLEYNEIYSKGIDIDVHGGLTYSDKSLRNVNKEGWFIGWDYAHAGDYMGYEEMYPEYLKIFDEKKWTTEYLKIFDEKKWTTEEIFEDVVNAINQIIEFNSMAYKIGDE